MMWINYRTGLMENKTSIIPVYTSKGEIKAFLAFPFLFSDTGEWIGWVNPKKEVYSVLGKYVGYLTKDPRILRKRFTAALKPSVDPPPRPRKIRLPAVSPLAPLMSELTQGTLDVLGEEPELLHTIDFGELKEDIS